MEKLFSHLAQGTDRSAVLIGLRLSNPLRCIYLWVTDVFYGMIDNNLKADIDRRRRQG